MTDSTTTITLPNGTLTVDTATLGAAISSAFTAADTVINTAVTGALNAATSTLAQAIITALKTATFAPTPVIVAPPPPPVVTATPKTGLMTFLTSLRGKKGKNVLIGQTSEVWNSPHTGAAALTTAQAPFAKIKSVTGKSAAVEAWILNGGNPATNGAYDYLTGVAGTQSTLAKGAIAHLSWWPSVPTSNSTSNGTADGGVSPSATPLDAADFLAASTPGTAQYKNMQLEIQWAITQIKAIVGTKYAIIFRPFIELNGAWNWYGAQAAAAMIALWSTVVAAFKAAGLANQVLFEFNVNPWQTSWNSYLPPAADYYVVSFDDYAASTSDMTSAADANNMYAGLAALNVPLLIAESGNTTTFPAAANKFDDTLVLTDIKTALPDVIAEITWCQGDDIGSQENATALMNDPAACTLSDLPAGV